MPACVAVTIQVVVVTPLGKASVVMFSPLTVQTAGVSEVRVGVSPEVAVALDAKLTLGAFVPGFANVIDCAFAGALNEKVDVVLYTSPS